MVGVFSRVCVCVFLVGEEIARPRRSTPTPSPVPDAPRFFAAPEVSSGMEQQEWLNREFRSDVSQNVPSFFGMPSEPRYARYDGQLPGRQEGVAVSGGEGVTFVISLSIAVVRTDVWEEDSRPRSESQLSRSFPTGGELLPISFELLPFSV